MSTQHPDNITVPFFSDSEVLSGEAEVREAYFAFAQLGCAEQMWDSEGKEADNQVVEKLLGRYPEFFSKNILGRDCRITYRVPNPSVEKAQGKILLETLHSIPRAFDAARATGSDVAPIFEVILPMTTSAMEVEMVRQYYEKVVIGQKHTIVGGNGSGGKSVADWLGTFGPDKINVIPLFENFDSITGCGEIVAKYLEGKNLQSQRVFIARSDPALNYGAACAVLIAKIALQELHDAQRKTGVDIYPILGVGGAPFRGNFRPDNVGNCTEEYPSVQTFTVQSSFKYDYTYKEAAGAIERINALPRGAPHHIDRNDAVEVSKKIISEYQKQVEALAPLINETAKFIPSRRARKLHVGLFGYSRSMGALKLPRAIKFCGALYSLGVPPELLGLSGLSAREWDMLRDMYTRIEEDLRDSARYLNMKNLDRLPKNVADGVRKAAALINAEPDEEYAMITGRILDGMMAGNTAHIAEDIKAGAWARKFIG
jgi:phosphoenolpyruvate carboxylase